MKSLDKLWIAGALSATCLFGAPALAQDSVADVQMGEQVIETITGEELVEILQTQGFAASLTQDGYGDPLIIAEAGGYHFSILTYRCDGSSNCSQLQMVALFNLPNGASDADLAMMNAYNQRFLYGRAYIDPQGAAAVDYTVNLDQGITEDNLIYNMMIWTNVLSQFVNGLGWSVSS